MADRKSLKRLQKRLLDGAARDLRTRLVLPFAHLGDVIALARRRLSYTDLAIGVLAVKVEELPEDLDVWEQHLAPELPEICERFAASTAVEDCERVAECLHPRCMPQRKEAIRSHYEREYIGWAAVQSRATLLKYAGQRRADHHDAEALEYVQEHVLAEGVFQRLAAGYHPAKGKTFDEFVKWKIIRCSLDGVRRIAGVDVPTVSSEKHGEDRSGGIAAPPDPEASADLVRELQRQIARLDERERLVLELRLKAYIDPSDMAPETLRTAHEHGAGYRVLRREFQACRQEVTRLVEEDLQDGFLDYERKYAAQEACHEALRHLGCREDRIAAVLEPEAESGSLGAIRAEAKALPTTERGAARRAELAYEEAYVQCCKAWSHYQASAKRWRDYRELAGEWVRAHGEVGRLSGTSQATAFRIWSRALGSLRRGMDDREDPEE